jgi:hypothetical protein
VKTTLSKRTLSPAFILTAPFNSNWRAISAIVIPLVSNNFKYNPNHLNNSIHILYEVGGILGQTAIKPDEFKDICELWSKIRKKSSSEAEEPSHILK